MRKQWKWFLAVAVFAAALILASVLYRQLSGRLDAQTPQPEADTAAMLSDGADQPQSDVAPDFTVLDAAGQSVKLSEHFGKPVIVNFWASWCGPCRSELGEFDDAAKNYAGTIDFMMVNLTDGQSETVDGVKEFVQSSGYSFPVYFDTQGSASDVYNTYSIPLTVFIRADGTLMTSHIGSMNGSTLQGYIDQLLAQ
ncbi:MAG: TlpA family protein disulfide reductase [Clostridia bacterium]|nr:TlpA family protein disulfide reductase [Clostridia bacterium]